MTYRDTWAVCTKCGKQFIFKIEDQRQQAKRGQEIAPPELCPSCGGSASVRPRSQPRKEPRPRPAPGRKSEKAVELGYGPHEGSVKWYDQEKGYGFIAHPNGEEFFFHRTTIAPGESPDFPDGTRVTYCIEHTVKGPQAVDVERMDT